MTDTYSLSDIRAATHDNDNGGMFGGEGIWGFILIFFILAMAGGGLGGFGLGGHGLTRTDLADSFNFNSVDNELRQIGNGIAQSNFATSNQLRQMQDAQAACCCDLRVANVENRYAGERNTCDIIHAVHQDGEATRALINANTMQDLRDRLEQAEREKLAFQYQLSQNAQSDRIIGELRPCAKPCYLTCSPYTSNYQYGGCGGYGYGNGF